MIRTFLVPLLAIAGVILAVYTVVKGSMPPPASPPVIEPPQAPYQSFVAGSGLVEPSSENISIGSPVGALVSHVTVKVGDSVRKGDVLFTLDTRELIAEKNVREAALHIATEQLRKLEAGTRPEELPPARARVSEAKADLESSRSQVLDAESQSLDAKAQLDRAVGMADTRAISEEEVARRRFALTGAEARLSAARARVATSQARLDESEARLALLEAGSWDIDVQIARAQVLAAKAELDRVQIELDRRSVKSPIDGVVLQRNVREGEFASAGALATPLMILGTTIPLHVRVDVDEYEAWRVKAGNPATAFARGNKNISTTLEFVRFEPFVVPKRSLTGVSTERVDTRVLQVIYRFDPKDLPLFVGQQVDVYIESESMIATGGRQ